METDHDDPLDGLVRRSQEMFADLDQSQFSEPAFEAFTAKIVDYIQNLFHEAIRLSRQNKTDSVSAVHVERASEKLVVNPGLEPAVFEAREHRCERHQLGTVGQFPPAVEALLPEKAGDVAKPRLQFVGPLLPGGEGQLKCCGQPMEQKQ